MRKVRRAFAIIDDEIGDIASINDGIMPIYWYKKAAKSNLPKLQQAQGFASLSIRTIYIEPKEK